jgi:hypothetical protein
MGQGTIVSLLGGKYELPRDMLSIFTTQFGGKIISWI